VVVYLFKVRSAQHQYGAFIIDIIQARKLKVKHKNPREIF
jgi:hypothetical protein